MTKINKMYKMLVLTMTILLVGSACENGFEEMNVNPFSPTETSATFLYTGIASTNNHPGDLYLYVWAQRAFQWSQLAASRGGGQDLNTDAIGDTPANIHDLGRNVLWNRYYGMIRSYRALEAILDGDIDQDRVANQRAIAYLTLAYRTFQITDMYGDMPFSEAGKGFTEGIPRPKYDTQQEIYADLLGKIDWAVNNMVKDTDGYVTAAGNTMLNYGSGEIVFGGDMEMWHKFGNALRLRHGLRIQNADAALARSTVEKAMAGPNFEIGEGLIFQGSGRYSGFQWYSFQRMGTKIWSEVNGGVANPAADGSQIIDPRVYGWFEPNEDFEWVALPNDWAADVTVTGFPGQDLRRNDNDDVSGTYRGAQSGFNWYTVESGANSFEHHLWGAEVKLAQAEAALLGWGASAADAAAFYAEGVEASIRTHHEAPTLHEDWGSSALSYPELTDQDIADYLANPYIALDGGADDHKKVVKQRWMNYFWNTSQAWHLSVRATDLLDLEFVGNGDTGAEVAKVTRSLYPEDESINNADAYATAVSRLGGDGMHTTTWWAK